MVFKKLTIGFLLERVVLSILILIFLACGSIKTEEDAIEVLNNHLGAIAEKDLTLLEQTLSPNGDMELILSGREVTYTTASFIQLHKDWFNETGWTYSWKILNTNVNADLAIASVEVLYEEADINGKPYFNKMIVGYGLRKENGHWYVIKDQATSIEKSEM
ncbi:MAG: nuclear transport factor 2 family protein [Fulvivirga sp.]|uniref:hypothetical protein n=1 Tax=Fulvivirga sp. TaxID=1931237 RepID=UPI0032FF8E1B